MVAREKQKYSTADIKDEYVVSVPTIYPSHMKQTLHTPANQLFPCDLSITTNPELSLSQPSFVSSSILERVVIRNFPRIKFLWSRIVDQQQRNGKPCWWFEKPLLRVVGAVPSRWDFSLCCFTRFSSSLPCLSMCLSVCLSHELMITDLNTYNIVVSYVSTDGPLYDSTAYTKVSSIACQWSALLHPVLHQCTESSSEKFLTGIWRVLNGSAWGSQRGHFTMEAF